MSQIFHYFGSAHGDLLPRWRDAFPDARPFNLAHPAEVAEAASLVWVRLAPGQAPAPLFESVRRQFGPVPIVALGDEPNDDEALACFSAGARAYCNTHAVPELLRSVAEVAAQGGLWIGESLMQRLLQGTARIALPLPKGAPADWAALLTVREREVAEAVAEGASNKEIARRMAITERTVKAHTSAIFAKLNIRDRLQLSLIVHGRQVH